MRKLSEELAGRLIIAGFEEECSQKALEDLFLEIKPGGIIFFKRNYPQKEPLKNIRSAFLHAQRLSMTFLKRPLFITVDHEGGLVQRLIEPFTKIPSAQQVAEFDINKAALVYDKAAEELSSVGFNMNLSPVLDLKKNSSEFISSRCYGQSVDKVVTYGRILIESYHKYGILNSGKHFPGLGLAFDDPHLGSSSVVIDKDSILADAETFKQLAQDLDSIMTSHIFYPALDEKNIATFSKSIVDILKLNWLFKGPILTDDLEMGAISKHYSIEEAAVEAINSGHDFLLVCKKREHLQKVTKSLAKAIDNNIISQKRLQDAFNRQDYLLNRLKFYNKS